MPNNQDNTRRDENKKSTQKGSEHRQQSQETGREGQHGGQPIKERDDKQQPQQR